MGLWVVDDQAIDCQYQLGGWIRIETMTAAISARGRASVSRPWPRATCGILAIGFGLSLASHVSDLLLEKALDFRLGEFPPLLSLNVADGLPQLAEFLFEQVQSRVDDLEV